MKQGWGVREGEIEGAQQSSGGEGSPILEWELGPFETPGLLQGFFSGKGEGRSTLTGQTELAKEGMDNPGIIMGTGGNGQGQPPSDW